MSRIHERFAPLTPSISEQLRKATPAANDLWAYLRQEHRPGIAFNVGLKEVSEALHYSVRWLRNALSELIEVGLVKKVEQWWGQNYRLVLPTGCENQESSDETTGKKNGDRGQKTSKLGGSKPYSSVPIQEREFTDQHGVSGNEKGIWYEQEKVEPNLNPKLERSGTDANALYQEAIEVAPGFNPKVFADILVRFGGQQIRNAISAVREQMEQGNIRNPAGALYTAIVRGFTSNQAKRDARQQRDASPTPVANAPTDDQVWYLPGTRDIFVVPQDERSYWQREAEGREREFHQGIKAPGFSLPEVDVSDELALISIAVREKQWSREQVSELLMERYQVASQSLLNREQLRDWLEYLRSPDCCDSPPPLTN